MNSLHYNKIAARTFLRAWDNLSNRDRDVIAADVDKETPLAKWFYAVVASETQAKYTNPDYWMNEKESFSYAQFIDPLEMAA